MITFKTEVCALVLLVNCNIMSTASLFFKEDSASFCVIAVNAVTKLLAGWLLDPV